VCFVVRYALHCGTVSKSIARLLSNRCKRRHQQDFSSIFAAFSRSVATSVHKTHHVAFPQAPMTLIKKVRAQLAAQDPPSD
jgi:hypothetical protein